MRRQCPRFAFVFPCFNEEAMLPHSFERVREALDGLKEKKLVADDSFALYVDDGSRDRTWDLIEERAKTDPHCRGLKLAGNVGHQNALYAGMMDALARDVDCMVSMDVDLQDDINASEAMLSAFAEGSDVVYGVRTERRTDTFFKRATADLFYRGMTALRVKLIPHHADCRLCGKNVLDALSGIRESELFLRAIIPSFGFRHTTVTYARNAREHGETKYPLRKMLSFAWRGVTSFSSAPLRLAAGFSLVFLTLAVVQTIWVLWNKWSGISTPGWSSMMIVLLFFSAVQLFCLSLIGEYIAKIFIESKRRPRYFVDQRL